jgi:hypothetical protein
MEEKMYEGRRNKGDEEKLAEYSNGPIEGRG